MLTDIDLLANELRRPRDYISDPKHHLRGGFRADGDDGPRYCSVGALHGFGVSTEARSAFNGFPGEAGLMMINDLLGRHAALAMFALAIKRIERRPFSKAVIETVKAVPVVATRATLITAAAPSPARILIAEPLELTPAVAEPVEEAVPILQVA